VKERISVKFSYYSGDCSIAENGLRNPSLLGNEDGGVDRDLLERELEERNEKFAEYMEKMNEVELKCKELDEPLNDVIMKIKAMKGQEIKVKKLKRAIRTAEEELQDLQATTDIEASISQKEKQILRMNRQRLATSSKLLETAKKMNKLSHQENTTVLEQAQARSKYDYVKVNIQQCDSDLKIKVQEAKEAAQEYKQAKRDQDQAKAKAQRAAPLRQYKDKFIEEWVPEDLEEIEHMIDNLQLRLENISKDDSIFARYESLEKEIKGLKRKGDQQKEELEKARAEIEEKKMKWLPNIKLMANRISKAYSKHFRDMGCDGKIEVKEDEDFEKYGLEIWVRFRRGAALQKLDKHTQSGGERSVSTMLYLLCLQEVTGTPFRVVDEINQGMDSKNERMIFNRIVASCAMLPSKDDNKEMSKLSPQYFLVTPKLLPNLEYPENADISVLCVYNGIGMLPHDQWNMKCVSEQRSRKRKVCV